MGTIRTLRNDDWEGWSELWAGYLAFYRAELDDLTTQSTFERLCAGEEGMFGLLAVDDAGHGPSGWPTASCMPRPGPGSPSATSRTSSSTPRRGDSDVGRALLRPSRRPAPSGGRDQALLAHPAVQRSGPLPLRPGGAAHVVRRLRDVGACHSSSVGCRSMPGPPSRMPGPVAGRPVGFGPTPCRLAVAPRPPISASGAASRTWRTPSTPASRHPSSAPTSTSTATSPASRALCGDARRMDAVADDSVALVVTSPPYFAGKQYEEELDREGVPGLLHRVPGAAARRLRRVQARARAGRPHRRQRGQPRPQALPQPGRRRHDHPAGRPAPAAPRRDRVAEGRGGQRLVRLGLLPLGGQPGAARRDRARHRGQQGTLRAGAQPQGAPHATGCPTRAASGPTTSWR